MLILARRESEQVFLGEAITVEVVAIRDNVVKLGFLAPPEVTILRDDAKQRTRGQDMTTTDQRTETHAGPCTGTCFQSVEVEPKVPYETLFDKLRFALSMAESLGDSDVKAALVGDCGACKWLQELHDAALRDRRLIEAADALSRAVLCGEADAGIRQCQAEYDQLR